MTWGSRPSHCLSAPPRLPSSWRTHLWRCARDHAPPTLSPAATPQLGLIRGPLQVVPDVLLSQSLQDVEEPKAATSSRSVLAGIMSSPASVGRFKVGRGAWAAVGRW